MLKKLNHKIFNLIIMIIISIVLLTIPNVCRATEYFSIDSPYLLADETSSGAATTDPTTTDPTQSGFQILAPVETDYLPEEDPEQEQSKSDTLFSSVNKNKFIIEIKKNVAQWYYIFRYMAIAIMLVLLIILAVKMAITSIAEQKALYKRMLVDWLVCFILLHFIHYFMIFVLYINEAIINVIKSASVSINTNGEYSLYETVRSRAYDLKFTVGLTGMILYMNLVWFTCKFIYIYAKRFITMIILTVIAPIIVLFYSLQKVITGSSKVLTKWMEDYALNVLLQAIHALLYAVFVGIALKLTESSLFGIIIALMILNFMSKADKIFREIFKFSDGSALADENSEAKMSDLVDTAKNVAMLGVAMKNIPGAGAVKKAASASVGAVARAGINIASAAGLGTALDKFEENSRLRGEKKNQKLDENIEKAQKQMKFTANYLANHNNLSDKTKKAFEDKLRESTAEYRKNNMKKSKYNSRRGIYQRMRQVLDPDTYMEYKRDENGELIENTGLKKKIFGDYKRKTISTKKILNPITGKKETIQSLSSVFKEVKGEVFGLTDDDKAVLKEARDLAKNGLLGFGSMMLGMASIADNPSLGFAMLAYGVSNTRKISNRKRKGFKVSRKAKRALRKVAKEEKKSYTFKSFSTGALLNIDNIIRELTDTDPDVGRLNYLISQMENGGYKLVTLPFTLTGTKGIFLNILDSQRKILEQHKKDIASYERDVSVKLMEAITSDVVKQHEQVTEIIDKYIEETDIVELIEQRNIRNYNIFTVKCSDGSERTVKFGEDVYADGTDEKSRIKNALINTAIKMKVYDARKLNFYNRETRNTLIEALKQDEGLLKDESVENINKLIFGNNNSKGIKDVCKELYKEDPNAIKKRMYQQTVRDYMVSNGKISLSAMDQNSIRNIYTKKVNTDNAKSSLDTLLVSMSVGSGLINVEDMSAQSILTLVPGYQSNVDLFRQAVEATNDYKGNAEIFKKFNDVIQGKQIDSLDDFKSAITQKQKELNQTINDVVVSALANNNIADPSLLSASPNDPKSLAFKEDVMNLLRFAGLQNSESELQQIIDEKVNNITSEDIESAIIKDETQMYINQEFGGDFSAFKEALQSNHSMQEEFESRILERLKDANKDNTSREQEIESVLDLIKGGKVADKTVEKSKLAFGKYTDENEEVEKLPYPEVKTTIKDDSILYRFFVPSSDKTRDCSISICRIEQDGTKGNWIDIDHTDLREDEKIIARLKTKEGKYGPSLVLSYPKPISGVISQIGKNKRKKENDIDDIERSVVSKMRFYDFTDNPEEKFSKETINAINDPNIEKLFRDREKTSSGNKISSVMDSILDYKKRLKPDDSDFEEILNNAVDTFDGIMHNSYQDKDEYESDVNILVDSLLQQKYASDDADSIKIKKEPRKNKKYQKAIFNEREITSKRIADSDFERLISSLNS